MVALLSNEDMPSGFDYPAEFVRAAELGVTNLEPWRLLEGAALHQRHRGLSQRYPNRSLVPFAARQDTDDVACWDASRPGRVLVIHDFASAGYELEAEFPDFNAWLRQALEDFIDFGS